MDTRHTVITAIHPLLDILHSGAAVAMTAPLFTDGEAFIGYYSATSENSTCAVMPVRDAHALAGKLYQPKTSVLRVHGLKRIWEALDIGTRDVNPDLISDTELMAYLLNPDAGDKGLTLSALCAEHLGEEYPHRILDIPRRSEKLTLLCSEEMTLSPRDHFWGSQESWHIFFSGTRSVSAHTPVSAAL